MLVQPLFSPETTRLKFLLSLLSLKVVANLGCTFDCILLILRLSEVGLSLLPQTWFTSPSFMFTALLIQKDCAISCLRSIYVLSPCSFQLIKLALSFEDMEARICARRECHLYDLFWWPVIILPQRSHIHAFRYTLNGLGFWPFLIGTAMFFLFFMSLCVFTRLLHFTEGFFNLIILILHLGEIICCRVRPQLQSRVQNLGLHPGAHLCLAVRCLVHIQLELSPGASSSLCEWETWDRDRDFWPFFSILNLAFISKVLKLIVDERAAAKVEPELNSWLERNGFEDDVINKFKDT
jgi:hypothetical protein